MRTIKIGMTFAGAIAMAIGVGGCADESPWGSASKEKGSISLELGTDTDITTAKPLFRSGEDETRAASGLLSDFITVPTAEDFSIRLEKADGSYAKTWATLDDFKSESGNGFSTGTYTLTAYYGTKGKQDFESPYFEASSTFTVLSDQTSNVELTAELKNSMVKINYTDAFKAYMQDYHTTLRTEGRSDEIVFGATEAKPAFIEPNNASLTVHFTTSDTGFSSSVSLGQFAPQAKTLHNVTFDVGENQNGDATLTVNFDDTLEDENFEIDLTEELLTTPAPTITCEGFADGQTVDMLEGSGSDTQLKMNIFAEAGIKSALLTVESTVAYKPAWGYEIDLCSADEVQQAQLSTAGITATGLYRNPGQMAFLDLTEYGKSLKNGEYTLSLIVTDKNDAVSKTTKAVINSLPVTIDLIGEPTIVYNSGEAVLTFDYNGLNPMTDLTFTAEDDFGNDNDCQILACEESSTRAFETKRYIFTIKLPDTTKSKIKISAYHNHKKIGTYEVAVIVPQYNISKVDAFSRYAYLQVTTPGNTDPNVLAAVVNNIQLRTNLTIAKRDAANGILTVTGLTKSNTYTVESSITGGDVWQSEPNIVTEDELTIPNGDFSGQNGSISSKGGERGLKVGGGYEVGAFTYTPHSSFSYPLPANWATINAKTAWENASNYNSWYVVPSSWLDNGMGLMRNVGYNTNGNDLKSTGSFWSTTYYCTHTPGDLQRAAGEFFLGSYSFNGSETRSEGIAFASRPKSITFEYDYTPTDGDKGYACAEILDASGNLIITKEIAIGSGSGTGTIALNYEKFTAKPVTLRLKFKSSNQNNPPITIPTGSALNEGTGLDTNSNNTIAAGQYKALATGSVLKIDNVTANYGDGSTGANAPKRNVTSKKR